MNTKLEEWGYTGEIEGEVLYCYYQEEYPEVYGYILVANEGELLEYAAYCPDYGGYDFPYLDMDLFPIAYEKLQRRKYEEWRDIFHWSYTSDEVKKEIAYILLEAESYRNCIR